MTANGNIRQPLAWTIWVALSALGPSRALAQPVGDGGSDAMSLMLIPLATVFTLGAAIGFCVGFLTKKIGKIVAVLVGLTFVMLQVLAYADIVTIDWSPVVAWWDQARRPVNLERQWRVMHSILFANVPALAGAVPGFVLGFKKG